MFWKKGDKTAAPTASETGATESVSVDAASEEARLKSLTGNGAIVITREKESKIKLPGL